MNIKQKISVAIGILGAFIVLGTAGADDVQALSTVRFIVQLLTGLATIGIGYVGYFVFKQKKVHNGRQSSCGQVKIFK